LRTARARKAFCPETGKKADLMFVQHIIASLKPDGHMDTIMLHGMLFRGQPAPLLVEAPLRLAQARPVLGLFVQEFVRLCGEIAQAVAWKEPVLRLDRLAPGDVAAVVRQYELWDETPRAGEFYDRLCAEVAAKREEAIVQSPTATPRRRTNATVYG